MDKKPIADVHGKTYETGTLIRVSGPNIILSPPLVVTAGDVSDIVAANQQDATIGW